MKKINIFDKLTIGLFLISVFQLFSYEYFKEIKIIGKSAYKEFYITEDIYANSRKNLDDIRIIDKNGKEIPYVIENEKGSKIGKFNTIEINITYSTEQKDKTTVLKINSKFLPLKKIVFDIDGEFKRDYFVKDKDENYLGEGTLMKVGNKKNLTVNFDNIQKKDIIIIEIRNRDNTPLKIKSIKGIYIPDRIVFKDENGESYKITFGDDSLGKPEYDIAQFSEMIKERDLVTIGEINRVKKVEKTEKPKIQDYTLYYNIFIGVVVMILIGFTAKKISKK